MVLPRRPDQRRRAGQVLAFRLFDACSKSLAEIRDVGYIDSWLREFRPYLNGALRQFSTERVSTTERFLNGLATPIRVDTQPGTKRPCIRALGHSNRA